MSPLPLRLGRSVLGKEGPGFGGGLAGGSSPTLHLTGCVCSLGEITLALSFLICLLGTAADPPSEGFLRTQ